MGKFPPTSGSGAGKGAATSSRAVLYKMSDGVTGVKPSNAMAGLKVTGSVAMADTKGVSEGVSSSREQQVILNLKRQVEELEASNHALRATGEREVQSLQVGELVMEALKKLDQVAYVRFASVYRSFQDIAEFRDEIERLEAEPASD